VYGKLGVFSAIQHDLTYMCRHLDLYEVVLESSRTVIVVTASVKDERGGQGHTSESLLHQSAT
jgi:hypothetical protein